MFVVGKLYSRTASIGHGKLPEAEWFEPILNTFNKKVERKRNAKELRRMMAKRLSDIKRREKEGKEPWFK